MDNKTHVIVGLCASIYIHNKYHLDIKNDLELLLFYTTVSLSSVLPDIDKRTSWIGRRVKILSYIIENIFGHRGAFHSLLFTLLFSYIVFCYTSTNITLAFIVGYSSHLLVDLFTPMGVPLFYPFKGKFSLKKRS